jgi:hypothetical protein
MRSTVLRRTGNRPSARVDQRVFYLEKPETALLLTLLLAAGLALLARLLLLLLAAVGLANLAGVAAVGAAGVAGHSYTQGADFVFGGG